MTHDQQRVLGVVCGLGGLLATPKRIRQVLGWDHPRVNEIGVQLTVDGFLTYKNRHWTATAKGIAVILRTPEEGAED